MYSLFTAKASIRRTLCGEHPGIHSKWSNPLGLRHLPAVPQDGPKGLHLSDPEKAAQRGDVLITVLAGVIAKFLLCCGPVHFFAFE